MNQNRSSSSRVDQDRVPPRLERSLIWRAKTRLQFTGWLQYAIPALGAFVFLLMAAVGWLIGIWPLVFFWTPMVLGSFLLLLDAFDVVTLKFGLRPSEALPSRKDDVDAFDLMRSRRSCRSFQQRTLTAADHAELMAPVRLESAPSHLLGDRPIRFEYVAAPLTVWPVVGAHEFLVAIAPREYDRMATIDVGRSLQQVVLQATRMGLATCWIGPGADQASVVNHLGDRFNPREDHVICVCAVGYSSKLKPALVRVIQMIQHRRLPLRDIFFADAEFTEPLDTTAMPFARFGRTYEACEWYPSSFNAQTTRCAAVVERVEGKAHLVRFDFGASTTSRYYAAVALGIWCAHWETGCGALGIRGHFSALTRDERGVEGAPELPRYDVSWVLDSPLAV